MAIHAKLASFGCLFPLPHEPSGFRVFGFIDNTIIATSRPGTGPVESGPGSRRKNTLIQRSFYNGWKKCHGIKFQTIDLPNGMNGYISGPFSCRRNDLYTLNVSLTNEKFEELQNDQMIQYKAYGDSAYIIVSLTHISARHHNEHNSAREIFENLSLSSCRERNHFVLFVL
jgi:hypothetical protein